MNKKNFQNMFDLKCPIHNSKVIKNNGTLFCQNYNHQFPVEQIGGEQIIDLRAVDNLSDITLTFSIPNIPISIENISKFPVVSDSDFQCISRENIRKLYGSKLQKEILYYIDILLNEVGINANILDLGCGNGGNKKYLEDIGFKKIISVDYYSSDAEYLIDVHGLPFIDDQFDMILSTATLEHFYNPYIAFNEMSRVLRTKGMLIASGSFWESWHGNSCFHFTPSGIDLLCTNAGFEIKDLWSGWGFIPSVLSHAFGLGKFKRITYKLQSVFDFLVTYLKGSSFAKRHKFRTSGSFGFSAIKK